MARNLSPYDNQGLEITERTMKGERQFQEIK